MTTDGTDTSLCGEVLVEGGVERGQVQVAVDPAELLARLLDSPPGLPYAWPCVSSRCLGL